MYWFGVNVSGWQTTRRVKRTGEAMSGRSLRGTKTAGVGACSAWRASVGARASVIAPRGALLARGGTSGYERSQGVMDGWPAIAWRSSPASRCGAPGGSWNSVGPGRHAATRSSARRRARAVSESRTRCSVLSSGRSELRCHVGAALSVSLECTAHETSGYAPRAPRRKRLRRMAGLGGRNPAAGTFPADASQSTGRVATVTSSTRR